MLEAIADAGALGARRGVGGGCAGGRRVRAPDRALRDARTSARRGCWRRRPSSARWSPTASTPRIFAPRRAARSRAPQLGGVPALASRLPRLEGGGPVLLYVGRFTEVKRVGAADRGLRARASGFAERAPLVLVGGFPRRVGGRAPGRGDRAHGGARRASGRLARARRAADFLDAADVVVLPSVREQFGQVLVEAMACGRPRSRSTRTARRRSSTTARPAGWSSPTTRRPRRGPGRGGQRRAEERRRGGERPPGRARALRLARAGRAGRRGLRESRNTCDEAPARLTAACLACVHIQPPDRLLPFRSASGPPPAHREHPCAARRRPTGPVGLYDPHLRARRLRRRHGRAARRRAQPRDGAARDRRPRTSSTAARPARTPTRATAPASCSSSPTSSCAASSATSCRRRPATASPSASCPRTTSAGGELEALLEDTVEAEGQRVLGWRDVPVDKDYVGIGGQHVAPVIQQLVVGASRRAAPPTRTPSSASCT